MPRSSDQFDSGIPLQKGILMTYAFYLDLPPLPDMPLNPSSDSFHQYITISCDKNGSAVPNTVCTRYSINPDIVDWAKQNISQEFHTIGLNHQGTDNGGVAIPHTDRSRNWTLIWLTDTGGTDVPTVFWQEKGFPAQRDAGYYPKSYDNLVEIESHVIETNRWILLNANVIHSVENLMRIRKAVQLGFWNDTDFIKKYSIE